MDILRRRQHIRLSLDHIQVFCLLLETNHFFIIIKLQQMYLNKRNEQRLSPWQLHPINHVCISTGYNV